MSLAEILEEAERLKPDERVQLIRQFRAWELAGDPARTVDIAARLDRNLADEGVVSETDLHDRLRQRGIA